MDFKIILLSFFIAFVTACGGSDGPTSDKSPAAPAKLLSILISINDINMVEGSSEQLIAIGVYDDDSRQEITSQVNWASSNISILAISDAGLAVAKTAGVATVDAELEGIHSSAITVNVESKSLESIVLSTSTSGNLIEGISRQYVAMGNYNNGTSSDISTLVTWSTNNSAVVLVDDSGLVTAVESGVATLIATSNLIEGGVEVIVESTSLQNITLSPLNMTIIEGEDKQFLAMGHYDNGTSVNITTTVLWSSSNSQVVSIEGSGLAKGLAAGSSEIKAQLDNIEASENVSVIAASLQSITLSPNSVSIVEGLTQQYVAMGHYDNGISVDISASVSWSSTGSQFIEINDSGLAKGLNPGSATIKATSGLIEASATVNVNNASLQSISITPNNANLILGASQQYIATGNYDNGTAKDISNLVTWSTTDNTIATINAVGEAVAVGPGSVSINASSNFIQASVLLTIDSSVLQSIAVTPNSRTLIEGSSQQFLATGTYDDGSSQDISNLVTWSSSDTLIATINNTGLAVAGINGVASIKAKLGLVEASADLTVNAAALISMEVIAIEPILGVGLKQQLRVMGLYDNESRVDISDQVSWSSMNIAVATVSSSGLMTGVSEGDAVIKVIHGIVEAELTVTAGYFSEGSAVGYPISIGNAHLGIVDKSSSIYTAGVSAINAYTVSLTGMTDDVDLSVLNMSGDVLCRSTSSDLVDDSCHIYPQDGFLFIVAYGGYASGNGANFSVSININTSFIAEGAGEATTIYPEVPHHGIVDNTSSNYKVALIAGEAYTVSLNNLTANAQLSVYNSLGDLICGSSKSGIENETCSFVAQETQAEIFVRGWDIIGEGANYSLSVVNPVGFIAEGGQNFTQAYVDIPYLGMVNTDLSGYELDVVAGVSYNVSLTEVSDDVDVYVYDGADNLLCSSELEGTSDESCTALAGDSKLYIYVNGYFTTEGGNFTLTVN